MIGLDTNILARYYIQDEADAEAEKQQKLARKLIESGQALMICKTVILEFEWVMRGYYRFTTVEIVSVFVTTQPLKNCNYSAFKNSTRMTRIGLINTDKRRFFSDRRATKK